LTAHKRRITNGGKTMAKWFIFLFILISFFGCKTIVHEHSAKTSDMYIADRMECEKLWVASPNKPISYVEVQKMTYINFCLKEKGWSSHRE
jgi:hypothetical protein